MLTHKPGFKQMKRDPYDDGLKFSDLADAYSVFRRILSPSKHMDSYVNEYFKFLGIEDSKPESINPAAYKKIKILLGPHAEAFYKAWKIKNG